MPPSVAPEIAEISVEATLPLESVVTEVVEAEPLQVIKTPETTIEVSLADIEQALESSGLVMIQTSTDKVRPWRPQDVEEVAPAPRRRRKPTVVVSDEPMEMIETRHPQKAIENR